MKVKDIVYLVISLLIFLAIGVWALATFSKKPTGEQAQYEMVKEIPAEFDKSTLELVSDPDKVRDFTLPIDLGYIKNETPPAGQ